MLGILETDTLKRGVASTSFFVCYQLGLSGEISLHNYNLFGLVVCLFSCWFGQNLIFIFFVNGNLIVIDFKSYFTGLLKLSKHF